MGRPEGRRRYGFWPERRGGEGAIRYGMRCIAHQSGPFMAVGFVLSAAVGIAGVVLEDVGYEAAASPIPFNVAGVVGAALFMAAFLMGSRSTKGDRPTVATVLSLWMFAAIFLIVLTATYIRFELAYPEALPHLPEWLVFGIRNAAFWMVFQAGWGFCFGVLHGWIAEEANPAPFRWLFKRANPGIDADGVSSGASDGDEE